MGLFSFIRMRGDLADGDYAAVPDDLMERGRDDAGDQSWREQAPTDPARVPHRSICHTNLVTRPKLSAELLRRLVICRVIIRMAI